MEVILSIKPEFARKIFSGEKRYEFRRSLFKSPDVKKVIVYASAPISKVIGEFEIEAIHHLDIPQLWQKTKKYSGISEEYYLSYFTGKEYGYAIQVKSCKTYRNQLCIRESFGLTPPQSFAYVRNASA